ncbi:recombinase family protein [Saccharibacillus kuerlensis]|uniref:Resolvase n=1 Tax=Saccharibacillus kuerlensis TaxID=459527 RepID=A0ABQ2KW33_9BACL|nr:recombinase family protein [Saccharibacillus kuerlensis]GGN95027.1 resolvase [Saccharibacillus kuerlensis]
MENTAGVAIYARVSTEEQAEHGYSIDAQLDTLRTYCKLYDKVIFDEYVDRGVSGKSMDGRFELQRMLRDAKERRFSEVVVWKFNRLARKNIDLLHIVDLLEKNNVAFRSFSENFETGTPMGRFALQMMGAVGELERNTIVENVKMGHKQRAKTGKHNGQVPLGYKIQKVDEYGNPYGRDTKVIVVEEEANLVRRIFEMYAGGRGLKSIANELNQEGHRTKRKKPFSTTAIKDIVTNPMFVGKIRYNRYENWSEKRRRGQSDNEIIVEGLHPAIISEELWEKVQFLQRKKSKMPQKRFEGEYLLTGIIRCPECGAAMTASRTVNRMRDGTKMTRMYYSCSRFRSQGSSVCHANSVRKLEAEQAVTDRIRSVVENPSILKAIVQRVNEQRTQQSKPAQAELSAVKSRIEKLEEKKRKYLELYEMDEIDRLLFSERLKDLNEELDVELRRRSKLEVAVRDDQSEPVPYELVRSLMERFEELLRRSPFVQRKTLLHLIVKRITLDERKRVDRIELAFNEEAQKHFLNKAPPAYTAAGAFTLHDKSSDTKNNFEFGL